MSIFPTRILLATDGSADAELALSTALDIADSTGSELHVLTVGPGNPDPVYRVYEAGLRYETYEQALEAVEQEARRVLDGQVRKVEEFGGKVAEAHLRMGERRDPGLVGQTDENGGGFVGVGSRGRGG